MEKQRWRGKSLGGAVFLLPFQLLIPVIRRQNEESSVQLKASWLELHIRIYFLVPVASVWPSVSLGGAAKAWGSCVEGGEGRVRENTDKGNGICDGG